MIDSSKILIAITLILVAGGIYLLYINLLRWKEIDHDTVRARVFLDRSFLKMHFFLLLTMGGIAVLHILMEPLEKLGIVPDGLLWMIIYEGGHIVIMLNLVLITYLWYILLHRKSSNM